MVSAAILFSGNTFANIDSFSNFCDFPISETRFYNIEKQYLWPIVNTTWLTQQKDAIKKAGRSNTIDICGGGRADSPGHNAKFGMYRYSAMDRENPRLPSGTSEMSSSNGMEPEGSNSRANSAKRRSRHKPEARVTNFVLAEFKVVACGS